MIGQSIGLAAFGILLAGIGALGWSGRLAKGSPRNLWTNYTAALSIGVGLLIGSVGYGLPPLRESLWGAFFFAVPALACLIFGLNCARAGPPVWATPGWQRRGYGRALPKAASQEAKRRRRSERDRRCRPAGSQAGSEGRRSVGEEVGEQIEQRDPLAPAGQP